jgi:hypothetical protein
MPSPSSSAIALLTEPRSGDVDWAVRAGQGRIGGRGRNALAAPLARCRVRDVSVNGVQVAQR